MNAAALALLAATLAHGGSKGSDKAPIQPPEGKFAVFAGAASDLEPILVQRKLERAQSLIVEELNLLLRQHAGGRYVPSSELKTKYGRDFLPIPPVTEYNPRFKPKKGEGFRACDPRTAELVRSRSGIDFFMVLWVLNWPVLEDVDSDQARLDPTYRPSPRGPYVVQVFSAMGCGKLAQWELSFGTDYMPRLALGGLSEERARDYAFKVARAVLSELREPLGLAAAPK